jgi:hypothetical protein
MSVLIRQTKRTKVSLKDIAREAQCSIAVAKHLNYCPHLASQSLIRGRTNTLGVYNPPGQKNGLGDGYAGRLLNGIELE